jgi:hypothetical protein
MMENKEDNLLCTCIFIFWVEVNAPGHPEQLNNDCLYNYFGLFFIVNTFCNSRV